MKESTEDSAGGRLRIIRETLGFTQSEFAEKLGLKFHQVQNIEYGRHRITEEVFASIGKAIPELLPWVVYGGLTKIEAVRDSEKPLCKLIAARIDIGLSTPAFLEPPNNGDK
ncbi:helix-turn-helix transcriptional regulator [uncultured Microbulbifer sp.]|uniref:helix-turn-helix domain-containing protein n=1 Tax=uncultured Microbulbifer sp. TaxID=348147 RepID=UPI00260A762B|nr:helix-turn-helix transcriptional regulator [uncultured Microbulbifer sp.]